MAVFLMAAWARADALTCSACGKEIKSRYVKVGGKVFHPRCFTCDSCGKTLSSEFISDNGKMYHPECYAKAHGHVCPVCGKILSGKAVEADGKTYHLQCYRDFIQKRCGVCGKPIDGSFVQDGHGVFYHRSCYVEHKLEKCVICSRPLEGEYLADVWGNCAHNSHKGHKTELCDSCGRIISQKTSRGGVRYGDGRLICGICSDSAVSGLSLLTGVRAELKAMFKKVGIDGIPDVPVTLVDLKGLKRVGGRGYNESSKGFTRVLTRHGKNEPVSKTQDIFILRGLPLLEFKGVLAHEMLHVWMNHNGVKLPSAKATEGFCNLGFMLVTTNDGSDFSGVLLKQLEKDEDPVYGDGYRMILKKLDQVGWDGLIGYVLSYRR